MSKPPANVRSVAPLDFNSQQDPQSPSGQQQAWSGQVGDNKGNGEMDKFMKSGVAKSYLSMRLAIIVSLLIATATVGGLSWYLTYRSSEKSISKISRNLQEEIQSRLSDSFTDRLSYAEDIVEVNKKIVQSGLFNPLIRSDIDSLMKIFWSEVRTSKSSSTATLTNTKGELWGHFIYPVSNGYGIWETVGGTTTEYTSNYEGDKLSVTWSNHNPGNLNGMWYTIIDPKNKNQSTWTDMYIWENRFWITRSSGAYLKDGTFVGVLCSDIELGFVDTIISDLKSQDNKDIDIFVVDDTNQLIGSSLKLDLIECEKHEPECSRNVTAKRIGDIKNTFAKAASKYIDSNNIESGGIKSDIMSINGKDYMISLSAIERDGLKWKIVSLIPQSVFMSSIEKDKWITMAYVFSLIGGLELILLIVSIYITRPLKDIAFAMMQISQLNFSHNRRDKEARDSPIKEVALIQSSFRKMNAALQIFGKFVPMSVVKRIMKNISITNDIYLERKALSISFTDLKGFTKLAESLPIDTLLSLLSDYLEMIGSQVSDSDGVLCDFSGDSVMSFWNSPVSITNHEVVAINTALRQIQLLSDLNRYWISQGYIREPVEIKIGIHTGEALIGNLGSKSRLKYEAIGDAVNLASRLGGLNKRYGSKIIISDATYDRVKELFICCPLETVIVKGRATPVKIYEVLASTNDTLSERRQNMYEKRAIVLKDVQDFQEKSKEERITIVEKLKDYVCHYDDLVACKILDIVSDHGYTGISVLDGK